MGTLAEIGKAVLLAAMKSTEFYRQIPGLDALFSVSKVNLDMAAKRVVVRVEIDRNTKWLYSETREPATLHKWAERRWQHLDSYTSTQG